MDKILFIMHTDWNWIKQRPHFIAENLSKHFRICVCYSWSRKRDRLTQNKSAISRIPIIQLPLRRFSLIYKVNLILQKILFFLFIKIYKPDIIWVTFPQLVNFIPDKLINDLKLIYDCMDDALEFPSVNKKLIVSSEKKLIKQSDVVFVSSESLKSKILARGCAAEKIHLVRNAFGGEIIQSIQEKSSAKRSFKIGYFGTVSNWIDIKSIIYCLNYLENVEFHFFGPREIQSFDHPNIFFHSPIEHNNLYEVAQKFDCMIMPFKLNSLIESVDPVKLYEYINFGQSIISVYYNEIKRFEPFVYFYRDQKELKTQIEYLQKNNIRKYSNRQRIEFLNSNSWDNRMKVINEIISKS